MSGATPTYPVLANLHLEPSPHRFTAVLTKVGHPAISPRYSRIYAVTTTKNIIAPPIAYAAGVGVATAIAVALIVVVAVPDTLDFAYQQPP